MSFYVQSYIINLYCCNKATYCSLQMRNICKDSVISAYLTSVYFALWYVGTSTSIPARRYLQPTLKALVFSSSPLFNPRKLLFWHHVSSSGATADTDSSMNHYMDSSHAVPTRISSPSSHKPCKHADWCVWHPKWTETARGGKTSHSEGLLVHHSVLWEVPRCCLFPQTQRCAFKLPCSPLPAAFSSLILNVCIEK